MFGPLYELNISASDTDISADQSDSGHPRRPEAFDLWLGRLSSPPPATQRTAALLVVVSCTPHPLLPLSLALSSVCANLTTPSLTPPPALQTACCVQFVSAIILFMAPAACPCARLRAPRQGGRVELRAPAPGTRDLAAFLGAPSLIFHSTPAGAVGRPRLSITHGQPAGGSARRPQGGGRGRSLPPMAALGSDDRSARPRFRVDAGGEDAPKSRFGPAPTLPSTPNERAAAAVAETMERLGVAAAAAPVTPVTRGPGRLVDLRTVNPGGAVVGAAGAAAMFWVLWTATTWLAGWYGAHPVTADGDGGYVVARISVVVRTAVVGLVALAAGMSGVTGAGLALLAGRVAYGKVTGVWPDVAPDGVEGASSSGKAGRSADGEAGDGQ